MSKIVPFIKGLYTSALMLATFSVIVFLLVSHSAYTNGHGAGKIFSIFNLAVIFSYLSLLISRIMAEKNLKWLWLGAPMTLIILGFILYLAGSVIFLNQ